MKKIETTDDVWNLLISEGHQVGLRAAARNNSHDTVKVLGGKAGGWLKLSLDGRGRERLTIFLEGGFRHVSLCRVSVLAYISVLTGVTDLQATVPDLFAQEWLLNRALRLQWVDHDQNRSTLEINPEPPLTRQKLLLHPVGVYWRLQGANHFGFNKGLNEAKALVKQSVANELCEKRPQYAYLANRQRLGWVDLFNVRWPI